VNHILKTFRVFTASIIQNPNGMPPMNIIKIENPGYYCSSFTPPGDHSSIMASGSYSEYIRTLNNIVSTVDTTLIRSKRRFRNVFTFCFRGRKPFNRYLFSRRFERDVYAASNVGKIALPRRRFTASATTRVCVIVA